MTGNRLLTLLAVALLAAAGNQTAGQQSPSAGSASDESRPGVPPATSTEPATAAPEPAPPPPQPVPPAEIAQRADITLTQLRRVREDALQPEPAVEQIQRRLSAMELQAAHGRIDLEALDAGSLTTERISDLARSWQERRKVVDGWTDTLATHSRQLQQVIADLEAQTLTWQATRTELESKAVPDSLVQRVRQVLDMLTGSLERAQAKQDALLSLQGRVSDLDDVVGQAQETASEMEQRARKELLQSDSPPLWSLDSGRQPRPGLATQLRDSLAKDRQVISTFFSASSRDLLLQTIVALVLSGALFGLQRLSRRWDLGDDALKAARHILSHPIAAALLLALAFSRSFHAGAPGLIFELNRLLLLAPILLLLPGIMDQRLHAALYAVAAFYIADSLVDLALEQSLLQRLFLLALTLLAMAGVAWMLRRTSPLRSLQGGFLWRAQIPALWLGLGALGASALANAIGKVRLAALLTTGVLNSAYIAIALFAVCTVLNGVTVVLLRTRAAQRLRSISQHGEMIQQRTSSLLKGLAGAIWVVTVLYIFQLLAPASTGLGQALGRTWHLGNIELTLGDIIAFGVALWLSVLLSRLLRFLLEEDVLWRMSLPRGMPATIALFTHYAIMALGFLVALSAAGIELGRFAILAGALGVGIGFGLQGLVNNFVSGLILIFERPIQIGDTVEITGILGEVRRIGFRSSTIRTYEGAEVIVPNGDLTSRELTNWTLSDQLRRIEIKVGVAYGTDPEKVLALLLEAASGHPDAMKHPEPRAFFLGFGDSSLNFSVRVWTSEFQEWWRIQSEVTVAINKAIREAGIEIPFPQRDLHLRSVSPTAAEAVRAQALSSGGSSPGDPPGHG